MLAWIKADGDVTHEQPSAVVPGRDIEATASVARRFIEIEL
tara:strand:+ start:335 stop:457 length:123 start_codon:yes stop_codon:yes gene_type:complete